MGTFKNNHYKFLLAVLVPDLCCFPLPFLPLFISPFLCIPAGKNQPRVSCRLWVGSCLHLCAGTRNHHCSAGWFRRPRLRWARCVTQRGQFCLIAAPNKSSSLNFCPRGHDFTSSQRHLSQKFVCESTAESMLHLSLCLELLKPKILPFAWRSPAVSYMQV